MRRGTIYISHAVKADDRLLDAGTYRVRLTGEPLKAAVGETPNLEQRVEFLQGDRVKAKAVASDQVSSRSPVPRSGGPVIRRFRAAPC